MSALAKKMMEKYGWKEGEGLGKERTGMKSYVKVVRRDPNVATGLGHAADPAQGGSLASTHAVELDAIYGQLHKDTKRRTKTTTKRARQSDSSSSSSSSSDSDSDSERGEEGSVNAQSIDGQRGGKRKGASRAAEKPPHRQRTSSSDSDDDEAEEKTVKGGSEADITRMTDKDLFQRCGGVRLGRAGRHRFFDGKLKRVHGSD